MKKVILILSIAISACLLLSCSKETFIKKNIEGTWGLSHYESTVKANGKITSEEKKDLDPAAPSQIDDQKMVITKTAGSEYLVTSYQWDTLNSDWISNNPEGVSCTIKNSMFYYDGDTEGVPFKLTSKTLTIEDTTEFDILEVHYIIHSIYVYRKMSD